MDQAVRLYLRDQKARPPGWDHLRVPPQAGESESLVEAKIPLAEDMLSEFSTLAEAEAVAVDDLASQAVMYLWAQSRPPVPSGEDDRQDNRDGPPAGELRRLGSRRAS